MTRFGLSLGSEAIVGRSRLGGMAMGVSNRPVAAFHGTPLFGLNPTTVNFSDDSTNTPTAWLWDFGDGGSSSLQNPSHDYITDGAFTVTLKVANDAGSGTLTKTAYIKINVLAAFDVTNTTGLVPAGEYDTPTLYGVGAYGLYMAAGLGATIFPRDHISFSPEFFTISGSIARYVEFDLTEWNGVNYNGYNSQIQIYGTGVIDGIPRSATYNMGTIPSHQVLDLGADCYNVYFRIFEVCEWTDGWPRVSTTVENVIYSISPPAPVASFTGTPLTGSIPLGVQFTDTSTNTPTSWLWDFGDGNTSTAQNPLYTYTVAGTYSVSLTATNAGGSDTHTATNYVTASTPPAPVASFTGTPLTGSIPLGVQFTDTSTNTPTSWLWDFGDGNTSTAQNPLYTYTVAGTYSVSLTATNAGGSDTHTATNYVTASPTIAPVSSFTGTPLSGNVPFAVQFTDTSINSPTSWLWDFGDGNTSTVQNPLHTYTVAGTYTVSLKVTNSAGNDTHVETNYVAASAVGTWSAGGTLNTARQEHSGFGTRTAGAAVGGDTAYGAGVMTSTEKYNGTVWSPGAGDLNTGRWIFAACGIQSAGLAFGGQDLFSQTLNSTESYNSTAWASLAAILITARDSHAGCGLQGAALAIGGENAGSTVIGTTEAFNSVAWLAGGSLGTARMREAGCGTSIAALAIGGCNSGGNLLATTETYNGTAWSAGGGMSAARDRLAACGLQSAALAFGGENSSFTSVATTESYNGTSWSTEGTLLSTLRNQAGCGTINAGLACGGTVSGGTPSTDTEMFTK